MLHATGIPTEMWKWLHEDSGIINKWDNAGTVSSPRHGQYTAIHCTGCFCLIQKDLFLSTGHGGGSASLESICNSHYCKQNRNGCNSDSTLFENARNIFNWYSKPFSASDQGGTVESEEYFCKVLEVLKVLWNTVLLTFLSDCPCTTNDNYSSSQGDRICCLSGMQCSYSC